MKSSSPQTQTTTSEPPAYLRPYLQQGVQAASNMFQGGGPAVIPFSGETNNALSLAAGRAMAGSPVTDAAQNLATDTLSGSFMGSNPYLDDTYNRAAQGVTNQVQTNFARAGRNPGGADAAGVAADRYGNLATQIYGGAYEAERDRMNQVLPFANQLASQDYADIGQLANVGAQREALLREQANAPYQNLDAYLARLQGYPGGTVTSVTPTERNVLGGALGGAMAGSMLGPWGMLGGGVLGGLLG